VALQARRIFQRRLASVLAADAVALGDLTVQGGLTVGDDSLITGALQVTAGLDVSGGGTASDGFRSSTFGTAGAPAYTYVGRTNDGLYSHAASDVRLTAGGVFALAAQASGAALANGTMSAAVFSGQASFSHLTASGKLTFSGDVTPAALTGNTDNYDPGLGGAFVARISATVPVDITGMTGGGDGVWRRFYNVGAQTITLRHENASSTASNRFTTTVIGDIALVAGAGADFMFDSSSSRWRVHLM